jgi:hypothetical protein
MTEQIDEETYLELYGVSPRVIVFIMGIITWVIPFGAYYIVLNPDYPEQGIAGVMGFLFSIDFNSWLPYVTYQNLPMMYVAVNLGFFNILFVYWMYRYYNGKSTKNSAISVGALSLVIPLIIAMIFPGYIIGYYVGPIPLQFFCGLYIMYKIPGPELRSPWAGQFMDYSWYHWRSLHKSLPKEYRDMGEDVFDEEARQKSS